MSKSVDLLGMFSNADVMQGKNKEPVFFKLIASIIDNDCYRINSIFLLYGASEKNEVTKEKKEEFFWAKVDEVLNLLKLRFEKRGEEIEGIKNKIRIEFLDWPKDRQISVSDYYDKFDEFLSKSKADVLYFNFQSGNVQSKEALMILYSTSNKEKLFFSQSIENKSGFSHKTDKDAAEFAELCKSWQEFAGDAQSVDEVVGRVAVKSDMDTMVLDCHKKIISCLLDEKRYFSAYYHYLNHRNIFEPNNAASKMRKAFANETDSLSLKGLGRLSKEEIAEYFMFRLINLKAKDEAGNLDTKIAYVICDKLLFVLRNLEHDKHIQIDGRNYKNSSKADIYLEFEQNYGLESGAKNNKYDPIEGIDDCLINGFNKKYNYLRHPGHHKGNLFTDGDFKKLLDQLTRKFEKEFMDCVPSEYKTSGFDLCFDKVIDMCGSDIKKNLKTSIKFNEKTNKICFLSMLGSTDPARFSKESQSLIPGSTLSFFMAIGKDTQIPSEKKELVNLQKKNAKKKIPFYCILSNEIVAVLFKDLHYDVDTMKRIYGTEEIYFLPFNEELEENGASKAREIIDGKTILNEEDLVSAASLKGESSSYDYKTCSKYIANLVNALLDKYDVIYLIESSGIPNCKMAMTFMSLCYPDRIKVINVRDGKAGIDTKASVHTEGNGGGGHEENGHIPAPQTGDTLLDFIEKDDIKKAIGRLFLVQNAFYDDFVHNGIELEGEIKENINKLSNNKDGSVVRKLIKAYYLIRYKEYESALREMDVCFETILGERLSEVIGDENEWEKLQKERSIDTIKSRYGKYIGEIENLKESANNQSYHDYYNRKYSFVRSVNYVLSLKDVGDKEKNDYYRAILGNDELWQRISELKHNALRCGERKEDVDIDVDAIEKLLMLDEPIKKEYRAVLGKYERIRNGLHIRFDED